MTLRSRWINGNVAYYDTHRNRILDAFGATVAKHIDHFAGTYFPAANNPVGYTTTLVGGSTIASVDGTTGEILLTSGGVEDDGHNLQTLAANFQPASGKPLYFGCRLKCSEATQSEFFIGLAPADTSLIASVPDNLIGFAKHDADTNVDALTRDSTTQTATTAVHTLVANIYAIYEFYYDGTSVMFYVDGDLVATHTTNIATDTAYCVSLGHKTGEGVAHTMTVDWLRAVQFN